MRRDEYLSQVEAQIRHKKAVNRIHQELNDHIDDQMEANMQSGMDPSAAEDAAIREMGDPVTVGIEMDSIHRPQMPWKLVSISALIIMSGFFLQFLIWHELRHDYLLMPVLGFYMIGLILMFIVCFIDYTRILHWSMPLYVSLCLIITIVVLLKKNVFHIISYQILGYGYFSFFAGSILLLSIPLYCGIIFHMRNQGRIGIIKSLLWMLPAIACGILTRCINQTGLLFTVFMLCLSMAIGKGWFKVSKKPAEILLWSCYFLTVIFDCLSVFLLGTPLQHSLYLSVVNMNGNYFVTVVRQLINHSLWFGNSSQNTLFNCSLSNPYNKLGTYLSIHYGIIIMLLFLGVALCFFIWLLMKSSHIKNQLGMLSCVGCSVTFLLQFLLWAFVNVGLFQNNDFYNLYEILCPFFSSVTTDSLLPYLFLGMILCVIRNKNVIFDEKISPARIRTISLIG